MVKQLLGSSGSTSSIDRCYWYCSAALNKQTHKKCIETELFIPMTAAAASRPGYPATWVQTIRNQINTNAQASGRHTHTHLRPELVPSGGGVDEEHEHSSAHVQQVVHAPGPAGVHRALRQHHPLPNQVLRCRLEVGRGGEAANKGRLGVGGARRARHVVEPMRLVQNSEPSSPLRS